MLKTNVSAFEKLMRENGIEPTQTHSVVEKVRKELLEYSKPMPKKYSVGKGDAHITKALDCFLNSSEVKKQYGHYFIDGNGLYYRTVITDDGKMRLSENLIALKLDAGIVGNSSVLSLIGRRSAWGNEVLNRNQTEIQQRLATDAKIVMLPFSVFTQTQLDIATMRVLERGIEETITRIVGTGKYKDDKEIMREETVHFTGASLFEVDGKTFLFDVDRRELEHKIFNPFLVELTVKATTIAEAYEGLKPQAVKDAEARGEKVMRQGEWFFIPVSQLMDRRLEVLEKKKKAITLQAGNNRPNTCKGIQLYQGDDASLKGQAIGNLERWGSGNDPVERARWENVRDLEKSEYYVTGKVEHTGREHKALMLRGWYVAVPNTATESFTITGDID